MKYNSVFFIWMLILSASTTIYSQGNPDLHVNNSSGQTVLVKVYPVSMVFQGRPDLQTSGKYNLIAWYSVPGTYNIEFDASGYSSGIYLYELSVSYDAPQNIVYNKTRKLLLIR